MYKSVNKSVMILWSCICEQKNKHIVNQICSYVISLVSQTLSGQWLPRFLESAWQFIVIPILVSANSRSTVNFEIFANSLKAYLLH